MKKKERPKTIVHKKRALQVLCFESLQVGRLGATDMDCLIEYKDQAYLFIEVKYMGKELGLGQRIALERLVNDTGDEKLSVGIVCDHETHNTDLKVDVGNCKVREVYTSYGKRWRPPIKDITVKELYELTRKKVEKGETK